MQADLVITNGKVITVDKVFSIKQAAAVKDGKILAVGSNDEVKPLIASGYRVLDLKGRPICPGSMIRTVTPALSAPTARRWPWTSASPRPDLSSKLRP